MTIFKGGHAPAPPAFLTPSDQAFRSIVQTLSKREDQRRTVLHLDQSKLQRLVQDGRIPQPAITAFKAEIGKEDKHAEKNRYGDIIPYDRTRVVLPDPEDHYINASWIREPPLATNEGREWIAAQAPTRDTTYDFLSMFLDLPRQPDSGVSTKPSRTILMLTACVESGRQKSARYWPEAVGHSVEFPHVVLRPTTHGHGYDWKAGPGQPITVTFKKSEASSKKDEARHRGWRINTLELVRGEKNVEVRQIEYLGWQDHGVPDDPEEVLRLLEVIEGTLEVGEPLVAHCSAGVGRTGSFMAVAWAVELLRNLSRGNTEAGSIVEQASSTSALGPIIAGGAFNPIAAIIDNLREQRTTMVQTTGQIAFVYKTLQSWWKTRSTQ